jgi:hypothetical protein
MVRYIWAGLALGFVALAGCCCHHHGCSSPAVCGSVALPAPAPCCGGGPVPPPPAAIGPTGAVYSSPVPVYPNVR